MRLLLLFVDLASASAQFYETIRDCLELLDQPAISLLQSGGNAIPVGKRKFSSQESIPDDSDSDIDSDAPLPGEADSDEDASELDSGSDTSQLQLPTDGYEDDSMSEDASGSEGNDSEEDAPLAAEQQPAASRQKPAAASKKHLQQLHQEPTAAANDISDGESDEDEEEAAANYASRRTSHQVMN